MKILLVEDDEIMARMYRNLFTHEGYGVEVARNGEEGLKKIEGGLPDMILLDVMMPKMNGMEFLTKIKGDARFRNIPVVLLTNLGVQKEIDRAIRMGVVKVITKSNYHPQEVVGMIKDILRKR